MTWFSIIIGLIFVWIIYSKARKYFCHKRAIGQYVTINYADQNISFETIFPKTGTIKKSIKVDNQTMFVVELDNLINYKLDSYERIVIVERHTGKYIGARTETNVHVLLPKIELTKENYTLKNFEHAVWATLEMPRVKLLPLTAATR